MARFNFCDGFYTSQALNADAQLTQNWYKETIESGQGKSAAILLPSPGSATFAQLPETPVRGMWRILIPNQTERLFAVSGSSFFEVFSDGTNSNLSAVANDGLPASMANSNIQIMIASGEQGYCYTLATGVLTGPIANIAGARQVGYTDGYFVASLSTSARFAVSNSLDGTTWQGGQQTIVSVFPDNVVSMIVDHREICLLGTKQSQCYYDSGNTFPYDVIPGAFAEQGSAATFGATKADNTVFWISQDERGNAMAMKAQGYTPTRISTHAIEYAWQGYSKVSDAEAYSFQDQGHTFVHWYFPTPNKSWRYDVAENSWYEARYGENETESAHRSRCHAFCFGKHLVGDWASGKIYQMSIPTSDGAGNWSFVSDFGTPIRRIRRSPYIGVPEAWNYVNNVEFEIQPGLGPNIPLVDGAGAARDPQIMLRWSKDGANTWSNIRYLDCGQIGEYSTRMIARRLGRFWGTRGWLLELSTTDAFPCRVVDAYIDADPAMKATERLPHQLRKGA